MSHKQESILTQPGLEVVIPTTPTPPPKIILRGPAVPEKDRGPSASPLLARGRNRSNLQVPPISAWSDSPVSEYGSIFPRSAYYRQSPWPLVQDGSSPWPSSNGKNTGAERRTFAFLGRTKFWLILGPIFLLLAVGLAVGLGVGLGVFGTGAEDNGSESGSSGDSPGNTSGNTSGGVGVESLSPTTPASMTSTAPSPTVSVLKLAPTPIKCPDANESVYQPNPDTRPFLVRCDVTYNSSDMGGSSATNDTRRKDTESVEECIDVCAQDSDCAGASWGKSEGKFTCWMKKSLEESTGKLDWFSVIKQE